MQMRREREREVIKGTRQKDRELKQATLAERLLLLNLRVNRSLSHRRDVREWEMVERTINNEAHFAGEIMSQLEKEPG